MFWSLEGSKVQNNSCQPWWPKNHKFIKHKELLNLCVRDVLEEDESFACNKCLFAQLTQNFWTALFREFPFSACYLLTSTSTYIVYINILLKNVSARNAKGYAWTLASLGSRFLDISVPISVWHNWLEQSEVHVYMKLKDSDFTPKVYFFFFSEHVPQFANKDHFTE